MYFLVTKKINFIDLGFRKFKPVLAIIQVISCFALFFFTVGVIHYITNLFNFSIPGIGEQQSYSEIFRGLSLYSVVLIAGVIAPIVEEITFRGLLFYQLKFSPKVKILLTAALFSLVHLQFEVFFPLLFLGVLLGLLRTAQNSIYPAIIFHIINNLLAIYATTQLT